MNERAGAAPTEKGTTPSEQPQTISNDSDSIRTWAEKLDATEDQIREALGAVGSNASDVEEHLKGSRATTTGEQIRKASGSQS